MKEEMYAEQNDLLSRRNFLTGAGALAAGGVIAASLPGVAHADEAASTGAKAEDDGGKRIFDGVDLAVGHVVHDPAICSGCRTCEIVCSVAHEGVASSELSRLKWEKGVMDACITTIYNCKQCPGAECVAVCPSGALTVDSKTGARVIDEKKCVGCQLCLNACPVNPKMIRYNEKKNVCFKCDLCDGDPQCVKFCPMGALKASWIEYKAEDKGQSLYQLNFTGDAKTWTHCETNTLVLTEGGSGLQLDGVVWTSHATNFNIILGKFTVTADFCDAAGNVLASSDGSVYFEIPEMSSYEFTLTCAGVKSAKDVGKIVLNVATENVTNAPGQEG